MITYIFPPSPDQTYSTWRKQTNGHQQHMFFLTEVELLQSHLELHQRLQKLQSMSRYRGRNTSLMSTQCVEQLHTLSQNEGSQGNITIPFYI